MHSFTSRSCLLQHASHILHARLLFLSCHLQHTSCRWYLWIYTKLIPRALFFPFLPFFPFFSLNTANCLSVLPTVCPPLSLPQNTTRCFITPTWSCFPMLPYNLIHYAPQYPRQIDWYAILFYIQHIFNVIMDDDYWLIYIYIYIYIYILIGTGGL